MVTVAPVRSFAVVAGVLSMLAFSAMLLAGCATSDRTASGTTSSAAAPSAQPNRFVGVWDGPVTTGAGLVQSRLDIKADGTWNSTVSAGPVRSFTGVYRIVGDRAEWRSLTTGLTGTWTVREGDGKNEMEWTRDDGQRSTFLPATNFGR